MVDTCSRKPRFPVALEPGLSVKKKVRLTTANNFRSGSLFFRIVYCFKP